jgi:sugar lactone lactonase YvrE
MAVTQGGSGAVMRRAKGGGPPVVLADGQPSPLGLRAAGDSLYWTNAGAHAIVTMPKAGGAVRVLATSESPTGAIVTDGASVWFADEHSGEILRTAAAGGDAEAIATVGPSVGLESGGDELYFLTGSLMRVAIGGGAASPASDRCFYANALVVTYERVFFSCQDGTVRAVAKDNTATRTIFSRGTGGGNIGGFAADEQHVYFTSTSDDAVMRVDTDGSHALVMAAGAKQAGAIAVDAAFVYYGTKGALKRVAK